METEAGSQPRVAQTYGKWAVALAKQGKNDEALEMFKKAEHANPKSDLVQYDWGKVLVQLGNPAEAKRHFLRAARLSPERKLYQSAAQAVTG
jgi:predicted Zn-dependent protease